MLGCLFLNSSKAGPNKVAHLLGSPWSSSIAFKTTTLLSLVDSKLEEYETWTVSVTNKLNNKINIIKITLTILGALFVTVKWALFEINYNLTQ